MQSGSNKTKSLRHYSFEPVKRRSSELTPFGAAKNQQVLRNLKVEQSPAGEHVIVDFSTEARRNSLPPANFNKRHRLSVVLTDITAKQLPSSSLRRFSQHSQLEPEKNTSHRTDQQILKKTNTIHTGLDQIQDQSDESESFSAKKSSQKSSQIVDHGKVKPATYAGGESSSQQPFQWSRRITQQISQYQLRRTSSFFEDDGLSHEIGSQESMNSQDRIKAQTILKRVLYIEGNLKELYKFEVMIEKQKGPDQYEDPNPDFQEGIFFITVRNYKAILCCRPNKQTLRIAIFDARSFYIFNQNSRFRVFAVELTQSNEFQTLTLLVILLTTVCLIIFDYQDRQSSQNFNQILNKINQYSTYYYIVECLLKMIAQGVFVHPNSYFRDGWNYLDFMVVLAGLTELTPLPNIPATGSRAFRVLRPLKSIRQFPRMRKLISGLINSIPALINALFFMAFVFLQFGIFGTEQFGGDYLQRCRFPNDVVDGVWQIDPSQVRLCSKDRYGYQCQSGTICGEPSDLGLDYNLDYQVQISQYSFQDYGISNMKNPLWSISTIFQCITLEGWSFIMYNHLDAQYQLIPQIYFIVLIIVGAFFLFHIVLAIIEFSLANSDFNQNASDNQEKTQVAISLNRRRKQLKEARLDEFQETLQKMADLRETNEEAQKNKMLQRMWFNFSNRDLKTIKPISGENKEIKKLNILQTKHQENIPNSSRKLISTEEKAKEGDEAQPFQEVPQAANYQLTEFVNQDQGDPLINIQQQNDQQQNVKQTNLDDQLSKTVSEDILPQRVVENRFYYFFYKLCINPGFLFFWTLIIIANSIVMTLDKYPEKQQFLNKLDLLNQYFSWLFALEMILKLIGFGIKEYLRDRFNIFDAIVVILCLVDNVSTYISGSSLSGGGILVLRSIRLLRVFKLARNWVSFRILLQKIMDSFTSIFTFSILLVIFLIVFIILGMQFFAGTVYVNSKDQLVPQNQGGNPPLNNFENLYNATTTVFAIMMLDNWNEMMFQYQRGQGYYALFFFQITLIVTNTILLNLFLALILELFDNPTKLDESEDTELSGVDSIKRKLVRFLRVCLNSMPFVDRKLHLSEKLIAFENYLIHKHDQEAKLFGENSDEQSKSEDDDKNQHHRQNQSQPKQYKLSQQLSLVHQTTSIAQIVRKETIQQVQKEKILKIKRLQGNCLFIFAPTNILRLLCMKIYNHPYFESVSNVFVLVSTVLLAVDQPLDDPNSLKQKALGISDFVITGLFAFEAIIKIMVFGYLINGKKSYLREYWNILDFTIVTISVISYLPINANLQFYKAMRLLRILRPLRMIQRNQGLQIAVKSLLNVLPEVFSLSVISLLTMGLFSVLGVNLYKGTFYSCNFTNVPSLQQDQIQTMWDCLDYGGEWVNSDQNFDNFFNALVTIFQIMSDECWYAVFTNAQRSTNIFQTPSPQNSYKSFIFFVCILMVQAVFIFNLFIGAVISTFDNEKEKISHNTQLTELEREYVETCIKCFKIFPKKLYKEKGKCLRRISFLIVESKIFNTAIFVAIIINSAVLSLTWYNQSHEIGKILDYINQALIGVFVIEFLLKFCAFGFDYFEDNWNVVDFLIVVAGLLGYALQYTFGQNYTISMTVVRAFRVVRLVKLVRRLNQLTRICMTFIEALPEILNIGSLLILFLFIFTILGTNLFAQVKLQENLDVKVNFQSFGVAFVTLFKTSTGENWPWLMADLGRQRSIQFQCQYSQTYEDMQNNGIQGCGSNLSIPFFITFELFVGFVMLNLFIAIILEGFKKELLQEQEKIQPETLQMFQTIWAKYDQNATGMIGLDQMEQIIMDLVQTEIQIQNQKPEKLRRITDDILFNFRNKKLLKLQTFWRQQFDDGSSEYQNLVQSVFFQKKLQRHFESFIGDLRIPTYNGLKNFNFHDVLISFVDFSFSQRQRKEFFDRKARIKSIVEAKQVLSKLDKIQLYSAEYFQLTRAERDLLRELETEDFKSIIHFIEMKGQRTDIVIQKIHQMQQLRRKLIFKNRFALDNFGDVVMTSEYVIAARCINNFIRQQRERGRFLVAGRARRQQQILEQQMNQVKPSLLIQNTWQKRKTIIGDNAFPIVPLDIPKKPENTLNLPLANLKDFFNDVCFDSQDVVNNLNQLAVKKKQLTQVDEAPQPSQSLLSDSSFRSEVGGQNLNQPSEVQMTKLVKPLKLNFEEVEKQGDRVLSSFAIKVHRIKEIQNNFQTLPTSNFDNSQQVTPPLNYQQREPFASKQIVSKISSSSSIESIALDRPKIKFLNSEIKIKKEKSLLEKEHYENSHRQVELLKKDKYTVKKDRQIKVSRQRPRSQTDLGRIKESTVLIYGKPKNLKIKMKKIERLSNLSQSDLHEEIIRRIDSNYKRTRSPRQVSYQISPLHESFNQQFTYRSISPSKSFKKLQKSTPEDNYILRKPPIQRTVSPNLRKLQTKTKPALRQLANRQVATQKARPRVQFVDFKEGLTEAQLLQRQNTE